MSVDDMECWYAKAGRAMASADAARKITKPGRGFVFMAISDAIHLTCDRTGFFVPTLRRVFGCLMPNGIAASRDSIGEFVGCPLSESPVRTALIIFLAPSLDTLLRFRQGSEPMRVQALRSERPVEGFDVSVVGWFPRSAEIDLYSVLVGPEVHDLTGELGPVITEKHLRPTPFESKSI